MKPLIILTFIFVAFIAGCSTTVQNAAKNAGLKALDAAGNTFLDSMPTK
jgi:uncharacterized protein YceK